MYSYVGKNMKSSLYLIKKKKKTDDTVEKKIPTK